MENAPKTPRPELTPADLAALDRLQKKMLENLSTWRQPICSNCKEASQS